MILKKGYFFKKFIKNKLVFINLSLLILIFCAVLARTNNENSKNYDLKAYLPIENVITEKNIFSLTVNINGGEDTKDVSLLSQVLKGLKTNATFFVTPEWINENKDLYNKIKNDGHYFGLSINNNKLFMSREDIIEFLASQNDDFINSTETFPKYVRIEQDKSGKIPKLLNAFGQKYISSSNIFETSNFKLNPGDIILINQIKTKTPYDIAEFLGQCYSNNYQIVSLDDLLNLKDDTSKT